MSFHGLPWASGSHSQTLCPNLTCGGEAQLMACCRGRAPPSACSITGPRGRAARGVPGGRGGVAGARWGRQGLLAGATVPRPACGAPSPSPVPLPA